MQFCKTSKTQYCLALQDSKLTLVCRSIVESQSFICQKGAHYIYAFKQYLQALERIGIYTKNMIYRAFSQFVIDTKLHISKKNSRYLVSSLLRCTEIDNIFRAIKYHFQQKLIDVWRTILEAYTHKKRHTHTKIKSEHEHFGLKMFHIPDQLKCMNDAIFTSFLDTLVQYLLEISVEVDSTLKEIRIVMNHTSTKEESQNTVCIKLKEKERAAVSMDCVANSFPAMHI